MNLDFFKKFDPSIQALFATIFTWFLTLIGSSFVFFGRKPNRKLFDCALGFAGGVMISASFFSLIIPAIEYSKNLNFPIWFPVSSGIILGCFFLYFLDKLIPHLHPNSSIEQKEGIKKKLPLHFLLVLAITLHNIPEGFAIGVSFGRLTYEFQSSYFISAVSLALGIGLQNLPEGFAVSLPLYTVGIGKCKSFFMDSFQV